MLETLIGFLAGFISSIPPMGPIAVVVVSRALLRRFREGLAIAAGSAIAEMVYALLALFGLDALLDAYPQLATVFQWLGVVLLVALGLYFVFGKPGGESDDESDERSKRGALGMGFGIAILNPTLPLTWSAGVAAMVAHPALQFPIWTKFTFSLAVGVGIVAWFGLLLWMFHRWGSEIEDRVVGIAVRGAGLGLLGIASWYGWQVATGQM